MLIDSYDKGVIDVLDIYMEDCEEITLIEFGRGNGALAKKYLAAGKKVTIIEDWKQQIYQADNKYYAEYSDITIQHNVLNTTGWDDLKTPGSTLRHKTELIFCTLPYIVPHAGEMEDDAYQTLLNRAFYEMTGLLRKPGRILTVDYNTHQIKTAINKLGMDVDELIDQGDGKHYMASVLNYAG
jgi:phospholipid N-methyltransferase